MMMKHSFSLLRKCLGVMESATNRIQQNPALQPNCGYVNIPVEG